MFKYLKDKIKSSISKVAKLIDREDKSKESLGVPPVESGNEIAQQHPQPQLAEPETHGHSHRETIQLHPPQPPLVEPEETIKEVKETVYENKVVDVSLTETKSAMSKENSSIPEKQYEQEQKKTKGMFYRIKEKVLTKKIDDERFDELFHELEIALLENNVAYEVVEKIKSDLRNELVNAPISRFKVEDTIKESLKKSIGELFGINDINLIENIKKKKPYIICFVGINGSGKTTTIAKIAKYLTDNGLSCVIAAADTFRAASIEQIEHHGSVLGIKVIRHKYGSDPAAVAFDAIQHAKSRNIDAVLIDTAGRMHSNINLINEMKKIIRVAKPDLKVFIGESITGNDCIEQARIFDDTISLDGIILTKADIDEKGGTAISIGYVTKKPILFLGTGQEYDDLKRFDSEYILRNLELS